MNHVIFLTGLPRSGTKLLRELMNNHSRISIPQVETVMIPYLVNKFGLNYDLNDEQNFIELVETVTNTPFYQRYKSRNLMMNFDEMYRSKQPLTWTVFFEELLRFYGPKLNNTNIMIGDKTPGYIDQTDLLLSLWPMAKIIHIIRDPRDYVCSVRKVWNKNIFRAANRWNRTMVQLGKKENLNETNLHTIYYENLLENPEVELMSICEFLDINFEKAMLTLENSPEEYGEARGHTNIVSSNKNKYKEILSSGQIFKVEQLVYSGAILHKYKLTNPDLEQRNISNLEMAKYKLLDGFGALFFHIREKGLVGGTKYFFQFHKVNI